MPLLGEISRWFRRPSVYSGGPNCDAVGEERHKDRNDYRTNKSDRHYRTKLCCAVRREACHHGVGLQFFSNEWHSRPTP